MSFIELWQQNTLSLSLTRLSMREVLYLDHAPCPIYIFENGIFQKEFDEGEMINIERLKTLLAHKHGVVFVPHKDKDKIALQWRNKLIRLNRSLSMGDPLKKGCQQLNLLSMALSKLYDDPLQDALLMEQFQVLKNFASFLLDDMAVLRGIYNNYSKQNFHYTIAQPTLSSLLLLGFLKKTGAFSERDLEKYFTLSYFKDIGMSFLSEDKYNLPQLGTRDKILFDRHPEESVNILKQRLPISNDGLLVIKNHHKLSHQQMQSPHELALYGLETVFITLTDIITAMTSDRPYRKKLSLYEALQFGQGILQNSYSREYRLLILFFKELFQ